MTDLREKLAGAFDKYFGTELLRTRHELADAALALLRSEFPGFEALERGEAVILRKPGPDEFWIMGKNIGTPPPRILPD